MEENRPKLTQLFRIVDREKEKKEDSEQVWKISDVIKSIGMLLVATAIGFAFWKLGMSEANIIMVYILGVSFTSVITSHQIYSLVSSVVSVFVFNFLFTEPRYTLLAYEKDYPVTFITMLVAAFLTGSLATRVKKQAKQAAEAALVAQKEQLRANLLRSVSHDLRTPLTSISGNASNLLLNGEKFDENTKKQLYLDIYDESMWLISLVENLLSVTKIEEGRLNIRSQAELLDEIITEALQHISRKKEEHKIYFSGSEDFILVKVDARLIMQVIINLVDNAMKYTQKGSEIVITTQKLQEKAVVRVADNGPGIPDEMKPLVFEMFYSGAKSSADNRRSLGLGLSLCKSIINAHGGELELFDNVPHGAVFTFTLPIEEVSLHE
ncbi:MAG: DUF4118 domain-containing protein [Roseburia sp.]